ncbi:hypothetical protein Krac_11573 [Ktedonobacter racemifer DSM 44963]|uniref:Uncharacterized protein n=1 Tax=Ktedonobacter racemifer DSM 44963 TaxID=485913 RepID=D6TCG3_KTERA|nr:hypothetical protein Krac_11573 [Ktedonobacter racemifer DSM 44963]
MYVISLMVSSEAVLHYRNNGIRKSCSYLLSCFMRSITIRHKIKLRCY